MLNHTMFQLNTPVNPVLKGISKEKIEMNQLRFKLFFLGMAGENFERYDQNLFTQCILE